MTFMQKSIFIFCLLLTLVFITLKLTSVIDWSWLNVVFPLWSPFLIYYGWKLLKDYLITWLK